MKNEGRIILVEPNNDHINRYISLSDDPELVANMGWKSFRSVKRKWKRW
jgi:hypothetical protein